jgi:mannosyl-oligosaccharide alpha-1,2-mannosidase
MSMLQGGKREQMFLEMYDAAIDGMERLLLKRVQPSNRLMLSDWSGYTSKLKMEHLACFTPGMLALGALHSYVHV